MSAMDKMAAAAEKVGHRVDEMMTGGTNKAKEVGMHAEEQIHDTQRSAAETRTTASHVVQEAAQQAGHKGESFMEKAKHAVFGNK